MSYEHVFGTMGGLPQSITGSQTMGGVMARAHLSLVPDPIIDATPDSADEEDQWQERALCAQTDPEAFFPEKGGSTARPSGSAWAARSASRASSTPWPTTSVSVSGGADSPSGSVVASSAASSDGDRWSASPTQSSSMVGR